MLMRKECMVGDGTHFPLAGEFQSRRVGNVGNAPGFFWINARR